MDQTQTDKLVAISSDALRKMAALLEAVASLIEAPTSEVGSTLEATASSAPCEVVDQMMETRKMPAMEQQAMALDDAVRGVARAIDRLEPLDSMRKQAAVAEIPLPEIETRKIERPEQMHELIARLPPAPEMPELEALPPGTIVEVEPVGSVTKKMGSGQGRAPARSTDAGHPVSFGRSHRK